ncbi:MAG: hypothetical protein DWQ08_05070 [Proteobacteria bacterium]|nr:MAG: hypothetical protein DWQ08_05070 [Pseudomonadota bacterium]
MRALARGFRQQAENKIQMIEDTRENTIYLTDVLAVIYRRRRLIIVGTVVGALLMAAIGYLKPQRHEYRAVIEIGRLYDLPFEGQSGVDKMLHVMSLPFETSTQRKPFRPIEDPYDAVEKLQAFAYEEYQRRFDETGKHPPISIEDDFQSRVIDNWRRDETFLVDAKLTTRGPMKDGAGFVGVVADKLVDSHAKLAEVHDTHLRAAVGRFEKRRARQENLIESLERSIESLGLERRQIASRIADIRDALDLLSDSAPEVDEDSADASLRTLFYAGMVDAKQTNLDRLQRRLSTRIPERESQLQLALDDAESSMGDIRATLDRLETATTRSSMSRIVRSPAEAGRTLESNLPLYVILGALAGFFLTLFAAFVMEFWKANRMTITGAGAIEVDR